MGIIFHKHTGLNESVITAARVYLVKSCIDYGQFMDCGIMLPHGNIRDLLLFTFKFNLVMYYVKVEKKASSL